MPPIPTFCVRRTASAVWAGRIALPVLGLLLAGCTSPATPAQDYPALQPIDALLAQADSAFSAPIP